MEVACGEYGDMVPPLVVAVQNNHCAAFQCQQKLSNWEKLSSVAPTSGSAALVDHNRLRRRSTNASDASGDYGDVRETAILGDEDVGGDDVLDAADAGGDGDEPTASNCVSLLHNSCRRAVPTLVLTNGDISCDVTLLKEVRSSVLRRCCS